MGNMIFTHISRSFRDTFPTRASEWALGTILFVWSILMVFEPNLMNNANLGSLLELATQDTWALLAMGVGGGRLLILGINGAWRRSPHLRATAAFISCLFWFQFTISIIQMEMIVTDLAIFPVLFLLDVYNVYCASRDAGNSDRIYTGATRNGIDT